MEKEIKYQVVLSASAQTIEGPAIRLSITAPLLYDAYESAHAVSEQLGAVAELSDGGVVINIIKDKNYPRSGAIDSVKWCEYWKYKCIIQKESAMGKGVLDKDDYEPCSAAFDKIFIYGQKKDKVIMLQNVHGKVVPCIKLTQTERGKNNA